MQEKAAEETGWSHHCLTAELGKVLKEESKMKKRKRSFWTLTRKVFDISDELAVKNDFVSVSWSCQK